MANVLGPCKIGYSFNGASPTALAYIGEFDTSPGVVGLRQFTLALSSSKACLAGFMLPQGQSMDRSEWEPVTKRRLAGFGVCFGLFLLVLFRSEPGFVFIIDHANLLFHEAGHPIIGLLSTRLEPYGGTVGQLVFPIVLLVGSWRKGNALGVAASGIWFFENWLNIARYLADARVMELPLVGGGDHDWNTILSRWGLLQCDTQIAFILRILAWLGVSASCGWLIWRAWQDRNCVDARLETLGTGADVAKPKSPTTT